MKKLITTVLIIWITSTTITDYSRPLGGGLKKVETCVSHHIQQSKKMR